MSLGLPVANTSLAAVTVSGRTLIPVGPLTISDGRQRLPDANGSVTLTGTIDGVIWNILAQALPGNTYGLVRAPQEMNYLDYPNMILMGTVIDFPNAGGCTFRPIQGGGLDAVMYIDQYGLHVRPIATTLQPAPSGVLILDPMPPGGGPKTPAIFLKNTAGTAWIANFVPGFAPSDPNQALLIESAGQLNIQSDNGQITLYAGPIQMSYQTSFAVRPGSASTTGQTTTYDQYGRAHLTQPNPPAIANGAGAGTSPGAPSIMGTDEVGRVTITTGSNPTGSHAIIATVTFVNAYALAPYGVGLFSANANAEDLAKNAEVFVPNANTRVGGFDIVSGQSGLTASTQYQWLYRVFAA